MPPCLAVYFRSLHFFWFFFLKDSIHRIDQTGWRGLCSEEHSQLSQRTQVCFPASSWQLTNVTPMSGDLTPYSGLPGHLEHMWHIYGKANTHKIKIKKKKTDRTVLSCPPVHSCHGRWQALCQNWIILHWTRPVACFAVARTSCHFHVTVNTECGFLHTVVILFPLNGFQEGRFQVMQ